jgi:signal transduction histidine kinase
MKRTALSLWFVAVAILVAGNSYVCYYHVRQLIDNSNLVSRSRDTILSTERVMLHLKDGEAAERGYIITGEQRHLESFDEAQGRFKGELDRLKRLVEDDPAEQRLLQEMSRHAEAWSGRLRSGVAARREAGFAAALAIVRQTQGEIMMQGVTRAADDLRRTETQELAQRSAQRDRSAGTATATLIGAGVLNLLLLGGIALAVRRDSLRQAREIEQQVKARELERNYVRVAEQYEERKHFAETLQALNTRLEQSNRELQDFASVASHDLQEPLRKIQAFGDRLRKRFSGGLGEEGIDYLDRMHNAASRMATLISDLLTFSRVTTQAQPFAPVDLSQVVNEVVSDLEARVESSGGRVHVEHPLPTIDADAMQMRQLFQNLISNGLKFRKPNVPPVVKVSAMIRPPENGSVTNCEISVSDNGIGFDEKYLDRIFNVFQRLHGRNEYDGTGIGLAVVRKIAERHGGTVTSRSREGEGATFVVSLPASHEEKPEARSQKPEEEAVLREEESSAAGN